MLYKSGTAGQEPCANAARDKGLNQSFDQGERGGRELRWREEAGANQLWFSVSCWDVCREREGGCSCGVERSVKPKKCHSHYTSLFPRPSACLFLRTSLLFFSHSRSLLSHFLLLIRCLFSTCSEPRRNFQCSLSDHLAPFSQRLRS